MIDRRPAICVRCGRLPRAHETFLCDRCLADPRARREALTVERQAKGYLAQRRLAIERFGWAGGWGRGLDR